ncbi:MAG: TonB-dependent receptor [Candidatus Wallbacteria bacterium]|nr:TonB-dependent receptor [Candidatus Wallbacteria bacterium]
MRETHRRNEARGRAGKFLAVLVAGLTLGAGVGRAEDEGPKDLTGLELEELMQVRITSVAKKEQHLKEAPAAIYVLTQADIRRSGATNLPDVLRLVPGVQVARIDSNKWAITARGFNGRFANKLLVLVDGRSVYTPLFSGVYWDVQDVPLEDIDRIEVVRGPGGTLYGANAVNGVINVITKHTRETQGGLATVQLGTEERHQGMIRHGGEVDDNSWYRVYAKGAARDNAVDATGGPAADGWAFSQAGFRVDGEPNRRDRVSVQGNFYDGKSLGLVNSVFVTAPLVRATTDDRIVEGGNLSYRLERRLGDTEDAALQLYYDRTRRDKPSFRQALDMVDLDFQHRKKLGERHELIWGAGARMMADEIRSEDLLISLAPVLRDTRIVSAFVQDEYRFPGADVRLTVGSKIEHNSYTGIEVQPSVRLLWIPEKRQSVWAAVSRAVRTPSRIESDGRISQRPFPGPGGATVVPTLVGRGDYDSEELLAREAGWRFQASDSVSLDLAGFYNSYRKLRTLERFGTPIPQALPAPHLVAPFAPFNLGEADTWGLELACDWHARDDLHFRTGCSWLRLDLTPDPASRDAAAVAAERENPGHQLFVSSSWELSKQLELDGHLRYVDELPGLGVPSYFMLDLVLAYRPREELELALVGRDLLDDRHSEFTPSLIDTQATEVQRGLYGKVTWRF